jgi:hypothetical protein
MSWKATSFAKDINTCPNGEKITRTEKLLLMVMADQHTTHQESVFVSQKNLSQESLLSVRHLRRCLESLESKGVIKTETGLGRGNLSGYSFPWLDTTKEDMASPISNTKRGHPETEKGTFREVKEDISRGTYKEVEQESGTGKVEPESLDTTSPLAGGAVPSLPKYDFGTFRSFYPDHRMWKHERAARDLWHEIRDDQTKVAIIRHLSVAIQSPEWKKEGGKYVPSPEKYLRDRYWEHATGPAFNHREETTRMHQAYIEISGQKESLCMLTEDRRHMLSVRWDEAIAKAEGGTPENAYQVVCAAIEACAESHAKKQVPKRLTLEAVFESTEKFERWLAEAYQ